MVVYDILNESILDAPRIVGAISGVVMCVLFFLY